MRTLIKVALVALFVAGMAWLFIAKNNERGGVPPVSPLAYNMNDDRLAVYPDSDNDGFADWEEALAGTDPLRAQSVPREMNELSRIASTPVSSEKKEASEEDVVNGISAPPITTRELPIDESASALRAYGNALATAVVGAAPSHETQKNLLEKMARNPDEETRRALRAWSVRAEAALAPLAPPAKIAAAHDALARALEKVGEALALIAEETPGVTDGAGWSAYSAAVGASAAALEGYASSFRDAGVHFTASEPGSIFTF